MADHGPGVPLGGQRAEGKCLAVQGLSQARSWSRWGLEAGLAGGDRLGVGAGRGFCSQKGMWLGQPRVEAAPLPHPKPGSTPPVPRATLRPSVLSCDHLPPCFPPTCPRFRSLSTSMGSTAPRICSLRGPRARSQARSSPRIPTHQCPPALPTFCLPRWACQVWALSSRGGHLGHGRW